MGGFLGLFPVSQKPVEFAYGQRFIIITAGTFAFARMVAYPSADTGKGMVLFK
jgi:hypothetical protein